MQGAFLTRGFFLIKSLLAGNVREAAPVLKNEEMLEEAVESSGFPNEGTTMQTDYRVEGDNLVLTIGKAGEEADLDRLEEELKAAVQEGDTRR